MHYKPYSSSAMQSSVISETYRADQSVRYGGLYKRLCFVCTTIYHKIVPVMIVTCVRSCWNVRLRVIQSCLMWLGCNCAKILPDAVFILVHIYARTVYTYIVTFVQDCHAYVFFLHLTAAFNVSLELQGGNCSNLLTLICRHSETGTAHCEYTMEQWRVVNSLPQPSHVYIHCSN